MHGGESAPLTVEQTAAALQAAQAAGAGASGGADPSRGGSRGGTASSFGFGGSQVWQVWQAVGGPLLPLLLAAALLLLLCCRGRTTAGLRPGWPSPPLLLPYNTIPAGAGGGPDRVRFV